MAPRPDPVATDTELPAQTRVVVIGGGIIGVSTAYFLARAGVPVVLCEKGQIAAEQSSRNWGWVRKMGRDPAEVPLMIEAQRIWAELDTERGLETGFRRCGIVYMCRSQEELARREAWLEEVGRPYQLDTRLVTRDQMARVLPGLAGQWAGGLYTPSDGRAEPQKAAPAIANAARGYGAVILTGCAVRGVERRGGRISGVVTEKGPIACDSVVLAGGVWSRMFCRSLGIRLPQLRVMSAVMRTEAMEAGLETSASGKGFAFRKRLDGGYTVASWSGNVHDIVPDTFAFMRDFMPALRHQRGSLKLRLGSALLGGLMQPSGWKLDAPSPFEQTRVLDPEPYGPILTEAQTRLTEAFPVFHGMRIAERWGGMIDVTPDAVPVISGVDTEPGFFIATGFTGHGFGIGPGAGRLMAEIVMGVPTVVDPTPYRYSRFTDGSRPRPHPLA